MVCVIVTLILSCLVGPFYTGQITAAAGPASADLISLKVGQTVEKELSVAQAHSYIINVAAEQFLRLEVFSYNSELAISVSPPGQPETYKWGTRPRVTSPIAVIAARAGNCRITLRPLRNDQVAGRYRLTLATLRRVSTTDRQLVIASRDLAEADEFRRQWTRQAFQSAIGKYEHALELWRKAADKTQEASSLLAIGDVCHLMAMNDKAMAAYRQALAISKEMHDQKAEAATLNAMGSVHLDAGESREALTVCSRALELSRASSEPWEEARALSRIGYSHYAFGEMERALEFLDKALPLCRSLKDRAGEAEALLFLAYTHHALKQTQKAFDFYQQALALQRVSGDMTAQGYILLAQGHLSNTVGERQQAFGYYDQARRIYQATGDRAGEAQVLKGIAFAYSAMGERQWALDIFLRILGDAQKLKFPDEEAEILIYVSEIYRHLGQYEASVKAAERAVSIERSLASESDESLALTSLGRVCAASGDKAKALDHYSRALTLSRKAGEHFQEGLVLNEMGQVHHDSGRTTEALDHYQKALALQKAFKDTVGQPATLYNIARAERDLGNLAEALAHAEEAIQLTESLRTTVASYELRASYLGSVRVYYDLYIDLLMRLHGRFPTRGYMAAAFQASERARARALLDGLTESRADIRQGVDSALVDQERNLRQTISAKAERQARISGKKGSEAEAAALESEIRRLNTEYIQVQADIRSKSPRYAALTQPQPLTLKEIQQQVLDDDTVLLECTLGEEGSFLWVVTPETLDSFALPRRSEIEGLARRVIALLVSRTRAGETSREFYQRVKDADGRYWQEAGTLSEMIIGPAARFLRNKRLLIVAEGALQYLPFGALPEPRAESTGKSGGTDPDSTRPLVYDHEVISLPSGSVMAVLRDELRDRTAPPKMLAILADPVFEADDPRVKANGQPGQKARTAARSPVAVSSTVRLSHGFASSPKGLNPKSDLNRALRDVGRLRQGLSVGRLTGSRNEAESIMALVPAGQGLMAMNFSANRAMATGPELAKYRIVHFATHGFLNSEHPELSGLVLSLVDEQGQPQNGFLRLHDIYNLTLPVNLVVLSACNSALGKEVRGEGLMGIVRGFMYAGAARVVASLWKVDDEATAELMKRFYSHMLLQHESAAAALRAAQIEMYGQKRWKFPFFWGAFVLQGEWK